MEPWHTAESVGERIDEPRHLLGPFEHREAGVVEIVAHRLEAPSQTLRQKRLRYGDQSIFRLLDQRFLRRLRLLGCRRTGRYGEYQPEKTESYSRDTTSSHRYLLRQMTRSTFVLSCVSHGA